MKARRAHWLATLNLAGWAAFGGALSGLSDSPLSRPVHAAVLMCMGVILTAGLRRFYLVTRTAAKPVVSRVVTSCAASAAGALIWWAADLLIFQVLLKMPAPPGGALRNLPTEVVTGGLPLLLWSFLYFAVEYWLSWNEQEDRLARASALAQTAQLEMLRHQLNPHFLFNALNSIRALIDEDAEKAREMITQLSGFLSYSLETGGYSDVPLRTELQAMDHYFAIQKKRYEDKLDVRFEIDPGAGEAGVLSFVIHPLVENAVKYGMNTSPMPLRIRIAAVVDGEMLTVTVSNTGRWIAPSGSGPGAGTSTGLENVRKRLENAYPGRHSFQLFEKDGWVHVKLQMPFALGGAHEIAGHSAGRG